MLGRSPRGERGLKLIDIRQIKCTQLVALLAESVD